MKVAAKDVVYLNFDITFSIGDQSGHDLLCCHFKGYSSAMCFPIHFCTASHDDLENPDSKC